MAEVPVLLVVEEGADFEKVHAVLRSRGLTRVDALPRFRTLKGFIDEKRVEELARVPGVKSIEKERRIRLNPPGAPQ